MFEIQKELCEWFILNHRKLPFRENKDPYSIWVSEIMAQQTRIDTMIPYYERWMKDYPTIAALADAPIEKVLKSWEGLGYYNRARKLHEGAKQVVAKFNGELPSDVSQLESLAGIGPYTAGAIASIAFGKRAPAIDGNVLRVVSRLIESEDDISKPKTTKKIKEIVFDWMRDTNPSDFTQGLMELGALICTPTIIKCDECPLNHKCMSYAHHTQMLYPIKSKSKKSPVFSYQTLVIIKDEQILISNDDSDGLMKGFYRLPQFESYKIEGYEQLETYQNVYSHKVWKMNVYKWIDGEIPQTDKEKWIPIDELNQYPIITAHKKILQSIHCIQ